VDFVEIETAWHQVAWGDKEARAKYDPPFYATGWWRWRVWRSPQAGLDHLDWAMTLTNTDWCESDHPEYGKPTGQAERAREIKELYTWWTTVYHNRPDPHDASGWSDYCEAMRVKYPGSFFSSVNSKEPEDKKASDKALKLLNKIEKAYEKEDTEMLIRLIKARDSLWT
jgi:hypothetical protein